MLRPRPYSINVISLASDSVKLKLADFIYHDTTGERISELQDPFNFQGPLGRSAVLDAEVYDLLARRGLRPARGIRQFDRAGCGTAGFSRLAYGGTEDLMRGRMPWRDQRTAFAFHGACLAKRIAFKI